MAEYDSTVRSSSPQPLDTQDIVREVEEVARECNTLFFPFRRIRCRTKTSAERKHITEVRLQVFERAEGHCELRISSQCWDWLSWETMHAAHIKSRGAGGPWTVANIAAACPACHAAQHNAGGKPCPAK